MIKLPKFWLLLCIGGCLQLPVQAQEELLPVKTYISPNYKSVPKGIEVMAFGDWGRKGEFRQAELAETMGLAADKLEPEFIISLGDNFYPNGVASVQDPQWQDSYEQVYRRYSLNCEWYSILGNHDYRGNPQAQIDYSKISRRWQMPARYYSFKRKTKDGGVVHFIFIDTNPLNDAYYGEEKYAAAVASQDTTAQLAWLRNELATSTADWKIVSGHHPLYSGGKRVNDVNYVRQHLEPLFEQYKVDVYLAGHEHDLQHIKPASRCTHHLVSGAGSEVRPTALMEGSLFAKSIQGFVNLSINKTTCQWQFMDINGHILHTYKLNK